MLVLKVIGIAIVMFGITLAVVEGILGKVKWSKPDDNDSGYDG